MENTEIPKLSNKQRILAYVCRALAGDKFEERATNLVPSHRRIKGIRLNLYKVASTLRMKEGARLVKKYGTHQFR